MIDVAKEITEINLNEKCGTNAYEQIVFLERLARRLAAERDLYRTLTLRFWEGTPIEFEYYGSAEREKDIDDAVDKESKLG